MQCQQLQQAFPGWWPRCFLRDGTSVSFCLESLQLFFQLFFCSSSSAVVNNAWLIAIAFSLSYCLTRLAQSSRSACRVGSIGGSWMVISDTSILRRCFCSNNIAIV